MILVTSEGKPFPRVAKGTVAKKAALKLYEEEIDALWVFCFVSIIAATE